MEKNLNGVKKPCRDFLDLEYKEAFAKGVESMNAGRCTFLLLMGASQF